MRRDPFLGIEAPRPLVIVYGVVAGLALLALVFGFGR
jgi:hypothetical protein